MDISLLPADVYVVVNKSIITSEDKKIINVLYLPIIGPLAVSLYEILLNDLDREEYISDPLTHAHILANLHISSLELNNARMVLEGIGLLKTYVKKSTVNNYIYELYSPVSSHEFFNHPIFNIVFYNNVGKKEYERILEYFKLPKINKDGYEEITKKFNQVFSMVPYTSFDMYTDNVRKYNKLKLNIDSSFDINFLIESMPESINKKIFTKDIQELIISLSYLYDIDVTKMQNIIKSCINERGTINKEELRKVARNHYQFDHSGYLPTIIEQTQPEYLRKPIGDNSRLAKMVYTFETTSPYDFLKSKQDGEPLKRDIKLIEDLLIDYKLTPGVINVLIDYVLKTQNNRLNRNYVEAIAGEWLRGKIETVEDAMNIAKKNHKKVNKTNNTYVNKENKEVPEWFNKQVEATIATDDERKMIEDMLKEYK